MRCYKYTDEDLRELQDALSAFADLPNTGYVMFNNVYSKDDALRFMERLNRSKEP